MYSDFIKRIFGWLKYKPYTLGGITLTLWILALPFALIYDNPDHDVIAFWVATPVFLAIAAIILLLLGTGIALLVQNIAKEWKR